MSSLLRTSACLLLTSLPLSLLMSEAALAQGRDPKLFPELSRTISAEMEATNLKDPYKGITTDGKVVQGLFPIHSTGIDTAPLIKAADAFIATMSEAQKKDSLYPIDDIEWRRWANMSIYKRHGVGFDDMDEKQKAAAWDLLDSALSPRGVKLARDIMHLNETLGELTGNNFVEFGEGKYWLTFMGTPSKTEPWGWQLDGHHLILNFFVQGDQIVMTPAFWGSEPAVATGGKYKGTRIMDDEQSKGLALINALDADQQKAAILYTNKTGNNIMTEAWSDNVVIENAGAQVSKFSPEQKALLMDVIGLYIGNMEAPLAEDKMKEITAYLDQTHFAWIGETKPDSVFYYRIQSPVVVIEFDHQAPVGLGHMYPRGVPYKEHVHSMVRTPNGNDYGKDLLKQHYAAEKH